MVTSARAGNIAVDNENSQYPVLRVAERSNPWALPQTQESRLEFRPGLQQQQNRDRARQYQPAHQWQPQAERFVTPEFLESLKQQQQQHQVMPDNQQYLQPVPRQYMQMQPGSGLPGQGAYSYPSYGAGSANPLYDKPAVSPWGDGSDVLYRGESFPMVPSEALGGFPPMHVPSFGMNRYKNSESGELFETDEYKVFNPFTFLPDGGSR
ncbi:MAG: hypothetical protein GQ550_05035 [Gammaproteobacteria bacterium]|nr:hypothetical protein [Gammaproteobacteria bacterium]